jgi:hypothetical protein
VRRDCTNGAICAAVEVEARKAEHVVVRDLLLGGAEVGTCTTSDHPRL